MAQYVRARGTVSVAPCSRAALGTPGLGSRWRGAPELGPCSRQAGGTGSHVGPARSSLVQEDGWNTRFRAPQSGAGARRAQRGSGGAHTDRHTTRAPPPDAPGPRASTRASPAEEAPPRAPPHPLAGRRPIAARRGPRPPPAYPPSGPA